MKKGLIILTIILTIIISTNISIYAEEYKTTENVETTREPEQITEEVVYYTVTFIDEVRNTRVVKTVKGGEHVEPACVSAEYIYLDEVTFKYFNRWVVRKGKNITGFDFNVPITSNVELYADYLTSFETVEFNPAEKNRV